MQKLLLHKLKTYGIKITKSLTLSFRKYKYAYCTVHRFYNKSEINTCFCTYIFICQNYFLLSQKWFSKSHITNNNFEILPKIDSCQIFFHFDYLFSLQFLSQELFDLSFFVFKVLFWGNVGMFDSILFDNSKVS